MPSQVILFSLFSHISEKRCRRNLLEEKLQNTSRCTYVLLREAGCLAPTWYFTSERDMLYTYVAWSLSVAQPATWWVTVAALRRSDVKRIAEHHTTHMPSTVSCKTVLLRIQLVLPRTVLLIIIVTNHTVRMPTSCHVVRRHMFLFHITLFFFFFFFYILWRMEKNKAEAHHTFTYFHTCRVSI